MGKVSAKTQVEFAAVDYYFSCMARNPCSLKILLLSCLMILAGCRASHNVSSYGSLADADKDGAITRGWIPGFLPASSRNIYETHEDSPEVEWCAFEFSPQDSQKFQKTLTSIEALPVRVQRVPDPEVEWWPSFLSGHVDLTKLLKAGFQPYIIEVPVTSVNTDILLFAIDWNDGRGFFYRVPLA